MKDTKKLQLMSLVSGMYFYTAIMTLFLLQRNITVGFLVASQTMFSIAMMLGELPTGVLADKYGQKVSIRLGLLLDAFGMIQLLLVHNPIGLLAYMAVRGVSVAFRSGSDEAILYDSFVNENGNGKGYSKAYGKFLANDILGFIIASTIAGVAVQVFGAAAYTPLIVLSGLTTLIALGITYTLKGSKHVVKERKELNPLTHLKESLKVVRRSRTIWALTVAGLLTLSGEYFLRQSYQPFFEQMAVPALFLGVALAAGKVLNLVVVRYSHLLEKYLTVDQIIFWINAVLGVMFVLFALVRSPWAIVPVFVLMQGLFNAERPIVSDYINQRIASHQRSTVLSAVSFMQNFAQMFARIILGVSIGIIGIGSTYIIQGAYLIIGAAIGAWYLRRCGCVHKVRLHKDEVAIEEQAVLA